MSAVKLKRVYQKGPSYYYSEDLPERGANGKPKQKWHWLSMIADGEAALHKALAEFHGQPVTRGNFGSWIAEFERAHYSTISFGVRKEYERMFAVIGKAFADFDVHQVEPGDVLAFLNDNFAEKRTARRAYKARLSTFFGWCVLNSSRSLVKVNPCREIKLPEPPRRRGQMTSEIFWRQHAALPPVGQCFLELLHCSRQRPHDIRLLRESMILADRVRIAPTKTINSSGEDVEFVRTPEIDAAIKRARELRAGVFARLDRKVVPFRDDPYLLVSEDGTPFTKSGLNTMWKRAREKASMAAAGIDRATWEGMPTAERNKLPGARITTLHVRPHALAQMEEEGVPLKLIREAAAHTTTDMTEHYLNQHRSRFVTVRTRLPKRPSP